MPVIVIGADTDMGRAILAQLDGRGGEIRAFVSDPGEGLTLKRRGLKVAVGDVSDASHVGGAALNCFSVILVPECAFDERERSFTDGPEATVGSWAEALADAAVQRVILIEDGRLPSAPAVLGAVPAELVAIPASGRSLEEVAAAAADADDVA